MVLKSIEVQGQFEIVLECIVVDYSFDDLGKYRKVIIGGFAVLCKLLRLGHHLRKHWCWDLGL